MLGIETKENWRQMGCQVGETFRDVMLGYRFFNEVKERMNEGCSVIYLAGAAEGPLLGRNCDLGLASLDMQMCRESRPTDGPATIAASFVGMLGPSLNEYGLVIGGASTHVAKRFGNEGMPSAILCHLLLRDCRTVAEVTAVLAQHKFLGKGMNMVMGDATGASTLFEFVADLTPLGTPRRDDRDWQACTNFTFVPEIPNRPRADYLQSAYARYGRVEHQLEERRIPQSFDALKQLLSEIAQPGLCCTAGTMQNRLQYDHGPDTQDGTPRPWESKRGGL